MARWIKLVFSFQLIFLISFSALAGGNKSLFKVAQLNWTDRTQDSNNPQNQCQVQDACNEAADDLSDDFDDDIDDEILIFSTFLIFPSPLTEKYSASSEPPPGQPDLSIPTPPPKN